MPSHFSSRTGPGFAAISMDFDLNAPATPPPAYSPYRRHHIAPNPGMYGDDWHAHYQGYRVPPMGAYLQAEQRPEQRLAHVRHIPGCPRVGDPLYFADNYPHQIGMAAPYNPHHHEVHPPNAVQNMYHMPYNPRHAGPDGLYPAGLFGPHHAHPHEPHHGNPYDLHQVNALNQAYLPMAYQDLPDPHPLGQFYFPEDVTNAAPPAPDYAGPGEEDWDWRDGYPAPTPPQFAPGKDGKPELMIPRKGATKAYCFGARMPPSGKNWRGKIPPAPMTSHQLLDMGKHYLRRTKFGRKVWEHPVQRAWREWEEQNGAELPPEERWTVGGDPEERWGGGSETAVEDEGKELKPRFTRGERFRGYLKIKAKRVGHKIAKEVEVWWEAWKEANGFM